MPEEQTIIVKRPIPWTLIAVIVAAGILLFIVFRGCGDKDVEKVKEDKQRKDSIVNDALEAERLANAKVAIYKRTNDSLARERAILKQQVNLLEHQLNISKYEATKIAYKVGKAKIIHDTVGYVNNCDSLVSEVETLTAWIDAFQEKVITLQEESEAEIASRDSIIKFTEQVYIAHSAALAKVSKTYDVLYVDYSKLNKIRKRERFLNRVLAVAVLGLGAKVALSK